ncbi:hypothetical protein KSS87_009524 [Heliosperma pusillum]|nr:hypothetical protein KSS87_009524 [Heliosperma pusillum]
MEPYAGAGPSSVTDSDIEDSFLSKSEYLTRKELMKRRANRLSRLARCYRDHYWLLMEDVRRKHRDFIWRYGRDFYKEEYDVVDGENGVVLADDVNNNNNNNNSNQVSRRIRANDVNNGGKLGLEIGEGSLNYCSFPSCKSKAMALTSYCHSHILSDSKQVLYTRCQFALKCSEDPILCGKPVLRSTVPTMCDQHIKMSEQNIRRAMKKGGASMTVSQRLAPKFHVVLTEYVRLIQNRRRARRHDNLASKANAS